MAEQRCSWCGTGNGPTLTNCINCGGPLPPPPSPDPGPPPPAAPRSLPRRYLRRQLLGGFGVMWGLLFGGIGGILGFIFTVVAFAFPPMLLGSLIGGVFFLVGAGVAGVSLYGGFERIRPLRSGKAAVAEIVRVSPAAGSGPATIDYTFQVGAQTHGGSVSTADPRMALAEPGHHVHVVYVPADPSQNSLWPPLIPADLL